MLRFISVEFDVYFRVDLCGSVMRALHACKRLIKNQVDAKIDVDFDVK